ncbi:MAG: LytTR family DNA-binding domain-containing protein [Bacteroidetes bacterium]|nr:LytTR family DNA-binding domain-containing protein [Bacteroidota bacterium]
MNLPIFEKNSSQEMLRTVIIDDEAHARETLARLLTVHCPQVKLIGEAGSVASGLKAIRELHPQLVLLDIKMDDGSGFDLIRLCDSIDFKVIFITAYEKYAVQAFRFAAVDFLLKPVNPEELIEAVKHAETLIQDHFTTQLQALEENLRTDLRQKKKIVLKTQENVHLVEMQNITFCESDGCYTVIHTTGGEKILISKILREFDDMLSESGFYRVHKSYLINLSHIIRFEKQEGGYIILTSGEKVPVSFRKREELLELFDKL